MSPIGAERQVEELGGPLLRRGGPEIRAVERAVELCVPLGTPEPLAGLADKDAQGIDTRLSARAGAGAVDDDARAEQRARTQPVRT